MLAKMDLSRSLWDLGRFAEDPETNDYMVSLTECTEITEKELFMENRRDTDSPQDPLVFGQCEENNAPSLSQIPRNNFRARLALLQSRDRFGFLIRSVSSRDFWRNKSFDKERRKGIKLRNMRYARCVR
jgi:hypothetical protein